MILATLLVILLTPWFWYAPIPKEMFNLELNKDIQQARTEVVWERGKVQPGPLNSIFINWPTKFVAQRLAVVMENLDIGNYFFIGHPRERVGIEEKQKFFVFQLVLMMVGFTSKSIKKYKNFLLTTTSVLLLFVFLFKWRDFNQTIFLSLPFILVMALGLQRVFTWPLKGKIALGLFSALEIVLFIVITLNR